MYPAFSNSTQKKLIDKCPVNWIASVTKSENTLTVPKCILPSPRLPQSFINHCSHSAQRPISQCLFLILLPTFQTATQRSFFITLFFVCVFLSVTVSQAGLKLTIKLKLTLNSWLPCFFLKSTRTANLNHWSTQQKSTLGMEGPGFLRGSSSEWSQTKHAEGI